MNRRVSLQVDTITGEIISPLEEKMKLDKGVALYGPFFKVFDRTYKHIDELYVGKYLKVAGEFMEPSQELMIKDKEIEEKYKLRKKDITDFLDCNKSTTSRFIDHLMKVRAIFKFDGYLIINPTFIIKRKIFSTKYLPRMLEKDPEMHNYLSKRMKEQVNLMMQNGDLVFFNQ